MSCKTASISDFGAYDTVFFSTELYANTPRTLSFEGIDEL
jgi:hypothetical protein